MRLLRGVSVIWQAFVEVHLEENVLLRLPEECGDLLGSIVRLNRNEYGLKQESRTWLALLTTCLKSLRFEQCKTDVCVLCLTEDGRVTVAAVLQIEIMWLFVYGL